MVKRSLGTLLRPLRNGAVVEGACSDARAALLIDIYACAALVCLCRDPPAARTGALYFANPLLALLNSRPAAWCPQHRSLQHIRCRWAVPYSSTGIVGQYVRWVAQVLLLIMLVVRCYMPALLMVRECTCAWGGLRMACRGQMCGGMLLLMYQQCF